MFSHLTSGAPLPPVERTSISEQIVRTLRREILSGLLPPGTRLPSEAELAHRFGTNRNTLREAIRTLVGLNLIHVRQGDGVFVRDYRRVGELSLLPHYLLEADPTERQPVLEELLELRRFVVAEAACLAARRATDEEVGGLRERLASIAGCNERSTLIAADLDFYRAIVEASHSFVYVWVFNTFERVYSSVIGLIETLWVVPEGYLETLTTVADAVAARDPDRARQAMVAHLGSSDRLVLRGSP